MHLRGYIFHGGAFGLRISKLSYSYVTDDRTTHVFENLTCDFGDVGMVFVLGKSGCGKSTLLSVLCGFLKPTQGEVISNLGKPAMVFQDANLVDELSVYDNVSLPLMLKGMKDDGKAKSTLERLGIRELSDKKCSDLSGGQKSRVALARALMENPRLILCDEPTGALDSKNANVVMETLKELSFATLVICVTHNKKLAREYGDTILRLADGRMNVEREDVKRRSLVGRNDEMRGHVGIIDALRFNWAIMKKRVGRFLTSILAIGFAFSTLACSLSLKSKGEEIGRSMVRDFYDYDLVHASEMTLISQSNGMKLTKNLSLSEDLLDDIRLVHEVDAYPSLSFFMPSSSYVSGANGKVSFQVEPCFFNDGEVGGGVIGAVANDALASSTGLGVGDTLRIDAQSCSTMTDEYGEPITFERKWTLEIIDIHEEIQGFSTPTIMYDYDQVFNQVENLRLETGIDYLGFANLESFKEDAITGFETLLVCKDSLELEELRRKIFKNRLSLTSRALIASQSIGEIVKSISSLSTLFLVIAIAISLFIETFALSSILNEGRRDYAIALAYSHDKKSFGFLYSGIPMIFALSSFMSFSFFLWILWKTIPIGLEFMELPNVFVFGYDFMVISLVLIAMVVLTILSSLLCYLRLTKGNLLESLRSNR